MKHIVNFLLTILVLFIAWKLFPAIIVFQDNRSVIITSLLLYVAGVLMLFPICCILLAFAKLAIDRDSVVYAIVSAIGAIIIALVTNIFLLLFVSRYYDGFAVNGGLLPIVLLSVALDFFSLRGKESNN